MKRSPLLTVSIRYGLVAGALSVVLLIALYYLGRHPLMIAPYLDFRIMVYGVMIFFCLKEVRDFYQQGQLHFWQGMVGSGLVVVLATCVASMGLYLFGTWCQAFVTEYVQLMTAYLKTFADADIERIGKAVYDRNLAQLPATNIGMITITYFAQGLAIGFMVSIVMAVVTRRQPKT